MTTTTEKWVYTTKRGKAVHLLKAESMKGTIVPEREQMEETMCGRLVNKRDFRDAHTASRKCATCLDHVRTQSSGITQIELTMLDRSKVQKLDGYVYCISHTVVHEDTLDPYWENNAACLTQFNGTGVGVKKEDVHRAVYVRWKVGDYPDVEA